MKDIKILDCTLRDGGYVNNFLFKESVIKSVIKKLSDASVDIIECGFLRSSEFDPNKTLFGNVEKIQDVIGEKNPNSMYVAMIQYGKFSVEEITPYDGKSIDGIRLSFHENEIDNSLVVAKEIMKLGYKIFMQPVGTTAYTDSELLTLIDKINKLNPCAFYIVDTLGLMYKKNLMHIFKIVDDNLNKNIVIGFHSHNNLQMSFANAQELSQIESDRKLIIDASVLGMGRAAGNLNTELLARYLNVTNNKNYNEIKILEILDEYIRPLKEKYVWGYDAAYYIAAITGCHPNYAKFLLDKQTLHAQNIYAILSNLDSDSRHLFNRQYIEKEYTNYLIRNFDDSATVKILSEFIAGRKILLLAPGKSLRRNKDFIKDYITEHNPVVIGINFISQSVPTDLMFISNIKRFRSIESLNLNTKILLTSNITTNLRENFLIVNYSSYTNSDPVVSDNAGLMCINLLHTAGANEVALAGFDGFSHDMEENFFNDDMTFVIRRETADILNERIQKVLEVLSKTMKIKFITPTRYNLAPNRDGGGAATYQPLRNNLQPR